MEVKMIYRIKALNLPGKMEYHFGNKELAEKVSRIISDALKIEINWEYKRFRIYNTKEDIINELEKS